jgi:beta-glucosidase
MTVPWGFRKLLNWIYKRYQYPIYVTENGFSVKNENDRSAKDIIHDTERVNYYKGYLDALVQARNEDKVDVRGYLAWSLLDNFEWASGLTERFGTTYVDYKTQTRTPKDSARYVSKFFKEHVSA